MVDISKRKHEDKQRERVSGLITALQMGQDPYPEVVEIHPTDFCPHKCEYCFHLGKGYDPNRQGEILTLHQYIDLFSEMSLCGISKLSISGGGEPTSDKRLPEIMKAALGEKLAVRLVTNGNNMNGKLLDQLLGCEEIRFSIDAATPETYESIRRFPGKYLNKTLENIALLREKRTNMSGTQPAIGTTFLISEKNYHEAVAFARLMERMGVDSITFKYDIYDEMKVSPEHLALTMSEIRNLQSDTIDFREKIDIAPNAKPCFTPYLKVSFNPYGELFSCCLGAQPGERNGYLLGNLHQKPFSKIWQESRDLRQEMMKSVACVNCNYHDFMFNREVSHGI